MLYEILKVNTTITELDIQSKKKRRKKRKKECEIIELFADNEIGVEGARAIKEVLKVNTTLTTLDSGGN